MKKLLVMFFTLLVAFSLSMPAFSQEPSTNEPAPKAQKKQKTKKAHVKKAKKSKKEKKGATQSEGEPQQ